MNKKALYIAGPTASGKTDLAVSVAQRLDGEIISCDSMQIYRLLQIGTAKPTIEEQRGIKHWLIDIVDPEIEYSVSDYVEDAKKCIDDILSRGKIPIIVGGTGYYMSALLHNREYNNSSNSILVDKINTEYELAGGPERLLSEIAANNQEHAAKLSPKDRKRIVRAVELLRTTGSTYSFSPETYRDLSTDKVFFLNASVRSILYKKIENRIDNMVSKGLLSEAKLVYDNRTSYKTAAQAIGYKEFFPYFEGERSFADCVSDLKVSTRHYAKRQITWFRKENIEEIYFDLFTVEEKTDIICNTFLKDIDD